MAGKFRFRFEPILSIKEKEEEAKKQELGIATKKLRQEEEALVQLYRKKQGLAHQLQESVQQVIKVRDLQEYSNKINYVDTLIGRQQVAVNKCENYVDYSRRILIEAKKQSKIYNRLKEKEYEVFRYEQMKAEDALVDQIVSHKRATK